MKAVRSFSNKLIVSTGLYFMSILSASASQGALDSNSDMGSMFLFSTGLIGLFAARRHMKHKAS